MPRQSESTRRKYAGFSAKNTTAPPAGNMGGMFSQHSLALRRGQEPAMIYETVDLVALLEGNVGHIRRYHFVEMRPRRLGKRRILFHADITTKRGNPFERTPHLAAAAAKLHKALRLGRQIYGKIHHLSLSLTTSSPEAPLPRAARGRRGRCRGRSCSPMRLPALGGMQPSRRPGGRSS